MSILWVFSLRIMDTISVSRKPIKRAITTKKAASSIPPRVEVYEHRKPCYSQSELEDCESRTKVYPAIEYSKQIHIETIEYMLAYLNRNDEEFIKLTENQVYLFITFCVYMFG